MQRSSRLRPFVLLALVSARAQEWSTYTNTADRCSVNLPGEPTVREITRPSEYGAVFPGRVYNYEQGRNRYSVTVVDYTDSQRIHEARTNRTEADTGPWYWQVDVQASVRGHHSHGNYEMTTYTYLQGTVAEVHWVNPHTWIYLEVEDDKGEATIWARAAEPAVPARPPDTRRRRAIPALLWTAMRLVA